jgi:predicted transcriptional regulator
MHKLMRKHAAGKKRRALAPKPPDPRDLKRLGKALAARRHKVGLTQNELVLLTGFRSEYISLLERGGRNPP